MAEKSSRIKKQISSDEIRKNLDTARENLIKAYLLKNFADQILSLNEFMDELETGIIKSALLISEENQRKAAFLLGMNPPTLCEKMKRFDIKLDMSFKNTAFAFLRSLEEIGKLIPEPEEQGVDD
jgi:DNA-binding protein Fis